MTAKLSTGYCLLLLEAIEWFMPLPTDFCQGDGFFYAYSVSQFMGYLKGKSSLMIFDRHANLKYKYGNRQFWCTGFYVDTVGRNKKAIEAYIKNQIQDDVVAEQLCLKELVDPFTGEPAKKGK